jgi:hypothetical protein
MSRPGGNVPYFDGRTPIGEEIAHCPDCYRPVVCLGFEDGEVLTRNWHEIGCETWTASLDPDGVSRLPHDGIEAGGAR